MAAEAAPGDTGWTAPYVSMKTLTNLLDKMASEPLPAVVDKGYLSHLSGSTQAALLASLRALDLIDDEGNISEELKGMARGGAERQQVFRDLAQAYYPTLVSLSEAKGTSAQLESAFRDMGSSGSTVTKQIRFFLQLMDEAGLEKSPHFKTPRASSPRKRKPATNGKSSTGTNETPHPQPPAPTPEGSTRTVEFGEGITLTLSLNADVLGLPREHRKFVMGLIDTIDDYIDDLNQDARGGEADDNGDDQEGLGA